MLIFFKFLLFRNCEQIHGKDSYVEKTFPISVKERHYLHDSKYTASMVFMR